MRTLQQTIFSPRSIPREQTGRPHSDHLIQVHAKAKNYANQLHKTCKHGLALQVTSNEMYSLSHSDSYSIAMYVQAATL